MLYDIKGPHLPCRPFIYLSAGNTMARLIVLPNFDQSSRLQSASPGEDEYLPLFL